MRYKIPSEVARSLNYVASKTEKLLDNHFVGLYVHEGASRKPPNKGGFLWFVLLRRCLNVTDGPWSGLLRALPCDVCLLGIKADSYGEGAAERGARTASNIIAPRHMHRTPCRPGYRSDVCNCIVDAVRESGLPVDKWLESNADRILFHLFLFGQTLFFR